MKKSQITQIKLNWVNNQGFTLVELLLAMVLMALVTTLAGSGLVALLQQNNKAEYETQRRTNLNRALDYIANDIRSASQVEIDSDTGNITVTIPKLEVTLDEETGEEKQFNYDADQNETRVYSIADGTGVWEGSKTMTINGDVLVDGIQDPENPPDTGTDDDDDDDCPTSQGTLTGGNGFYACIYDGGNKVDLYLYGKLTDDKKSSDYKKPLEVKQTVFTRSKAYDTTN